MSLHEYHLVAAGWLILILFLSVFWYATLSRLSGVLKERLSAKHFRESVPGLRGVFLFIMRGEFKETGDDRLIAVCRRLRQLLYGYLGSIGAYLVFVVVFRPAH